MSVLRDSGKCGPCLLDEDVRVCHDEGTVDVDGAVVAAILMPEERWFSVDMTTTWW